MHPARIRKERHFQSLITGDVVIHPFKQELFKFRRVKRKDGSHHYLNIVLQGSDLEVEFLNASKYYIQWKQMKITSTQDKSHRVVNVVV